MTSANRNQAEPGRVFNPLQMTARNEEFYTELRRWISAGVPAVWVSTADDHDCYANVCQVAETLNFQVFAWDSVRGWWGGTVDMREEVKRVCEKLGLKTLDPELMLPHNVLRAVLEFRTGRPGGEDAVVVLNNFHEFFYGNPGRQVREVLHTLTRNSELTTQEWGMRPVVFLSHGDGIDPHPEVAGRVQRIDFTLPTKDEILAGPIEYIASSMETTRPDTFVRPARDFLRAVAAACAGLHRTRVSNLLAYVTAVNQGMSDAILPAIRREKSKEIARSKVLVPMGDGELASADQIGGMDALLADIRLQATAYTDEARRVGLNLPSGIILCGMPGTGKSLVAKAAGNIFKGVLGNEFPVIRIDIGAIFGRYLGDSESAWREAKRVLRTAGPCVALVDEAQRAFSGMASGSNNDGGVSQRVFADFLSWCQDRFDQGDQTYLILTMNNPKMLSEHSPEFFQRFDSMYFVDLPDAEDRKAIFKIHLRLQLDKVRDADGNPKGLTLDALGWTEAEYDALATATDGFVGREIARAVAQSRFLSTHPDRLPDFDTLVGAQVLGALKDEVSNETMQEELAQLRHDCARAKRVKSTPPAPRVRNLKPAESDPPRPRRIIKEPGPGDPRRPSNN